MGAVFLITILIPFVLVSCDTVTDTTVVEKQEGLISSSDTNSSLNVTTLSPTLTEEKADGIKVELVEGQSEGRDFGLSLLAILGVGAVILLPLLGLLLLLLFVPVPSLYFPLGTLPGVNNGVLVTGKMLKSEMFNKLSSETGRALREILESDNCVQRISCEISEILKASKGINMDKWIHRMINEIPVGKELQWKVNRAAQATRNCQVFSCQSITNILKMFS